MYKTVSGYCPVENSDKAIGITYSEIPRTGTLQKAYKAIRHDCENEECPEKYCPIFMAHSSI